MNRLFREKNPYLLLHATNPVDWFPWSDAAFDLAAKRNVPIFISIGYASCHWCHVMERESFSSAKIAEFLNKNFLNIKLDREERPDIDAIYMRSAEVLGVQGGWPLSIFATPQGKPFFIGTYFPAIRRHSNPSFLDVITHCAQLWEKKYNAILLHAEEVYTAVQNSFLSRDAKNWKWETQTTERPLKEDFRLNTSPYFGEDRLFAEHHLRYFDKENGGFLFHSKVKFPHFLNLEHLLRIAERESRKEIAEIVIFSLKSMLSGGIYDHLEGGICRYSTDYGWKVPHFEKTLYDNAWLLNLLVSCVRSSFVSCDAQAEKYFLEKACEVFLFLDKKLTSATGLFYVALDSESGGEEGAHCTWTKEELKEVFENLDQRYKKSAKNSEQTGMKVETEVLFNACFKLHYCRELKGRFVLLLGDSMPVISRRFNMSETDCEKRITELKKTLLNARSKRQQPLLDKKSLMSWNGFTLNALARLALLLFDKKHPLAREVAKRVQELCLAFRKNLAGTGDYFFRRVAQSQKAHLGQLADYASYGVGLCAVHELGARHCEFEVVLKNRAEAKRTPLEEAKKISELIKTLFYDEEKGFFYETSRRQQSRKSDLFSFAEIYEDVEPCGNSLTAELFARLSQYDSRDSYVKTVNRLFRVFASPIAEMKLPYMQKVLHDCKRGYWRLLFSENKNSENKKKENKNFLAKQSKTNVDNRWWSSVVAEKNDTERLLCLSIGSNEEKQHALQKFLKNSISEKIQESSLLNKLLLDKNAVLLCHENRCLLPAQNVRQLRARLDEINQT